MRTPHSSPLSPADAAVAMRTWPRRYRAVLAPAQDEQVAELALRIGPDGVCALDLAVDSVRTWTLLDRALHDLRFADAPTLHPAVADPAARTWDSPAVESLESILDQIDDTSVALADAIDATPTEDWSRTASVAGGGTVDALSVAREAVRVGAENLRSIERTLSAVR